MSLLDLAILAQVLVWAIMAGVFVASRQASLFHPVTWYLAFHALVFVLRPILVHTLNFDFSFRYMLFWPTDEIFIRTLAASSVGLVVFVLGCLAASRTQPAFTHHAYRGFSVIEIRALLVVTMILLPVIAYSIYQTNSGNLVGKNVNGIYINTNSVGYMNDAQFALMTLLCAWLVASKFHWLNLIPTALYILYRVWSGWARFTIVLFLALVVVVYCWQNRKRWVPLWAIAAAFPAMMLFTIIGHNRDLLKQYLSGQEIRTLDYNPGMTEAQKLKLQYDNPDAANFDYLSYVIAIVPDRTGTYTYGAQYLQLFTEPIPRALWKGKPIGAPVAFFSLNTYGNFIGLTVSLVGDGWMSGGWIGVIILMSLVGTFLGFAHRWFWHNVDNKFSALIYLTFLPMLAQWYRDGGISIAKFMLWNWLPMFMWIGVSWLMGARLISGGTVLLPRGTQVKLVSPGMSSPPVSTVPADNSENIVPA